MGFLERLYGLLLFLYPAEHRREYGVEMLQLFGDQLCEAQRSGTMSVLRLVWRTTLDIARTAPAEHLHTLEESLSMNRAVEPFPWWQVALVVLPGLLSLPGLLTGDTTWLTFLALTTVIIAAGAGVSWARAGRLPDWGLLVAGLLFIVGVVAVGERIAAPLGLMHSNTVIAILMTVALIVVIWVFVRHLRAHRMPRAAWVLVVLLVLGVVALELTWFPDPYNFAQLVAAQGPMLAMSAALFLLPVAVGLRLAPRYGVTAALFVVGAYFPIFHVVMDPDSSFDFWMDYPATVIFRFGLVLLFVVAGPLLAARASTVRGRMVGLAVPVGLALLASVIVPAVLHPDVTTAFWLRLLLTNVELLLLLLLAMVLYAQAGRTAGEKAAPVGTAPEVAA